MGEVLEQLRVLVVDDEPSIRTAIVARLEAEKILSVAVGSGQAAIEACRLRAFDVALVDFRIGPTSGIDLLSALLAEAPWMKVIIITAFASFEIAVEAIRRGACNFLPKPFTAEQLRIVLAEAVRQRNLELRVTNQPAPDQPVDFRSDDPAMVSAIEVARQVADSDATILIRGETGTGKGEFAKAIHRWSPRTSRPFGVISCPSLSTELLESELFGHRKGAFTNAVRDNPGRVAACDGGTLFLDEIGDLPMALQSKLLRFIQDREYERVGDHVTRKADVRVVAATNVNVEQAVAEGRFRQDLLYRLNVIQIDIPPLRSRPADTLGIADGLLAKFAKASNKPQIHLSAEAREAVTRYAWPGNVRELRNVLERAVILCRSNEIGVELLRLEPAAKRDYASLIGSHVPMEKIEEMHIRGVMASVPSIEAASAILGLDSVTLWRRRKKYGIE